MDVSVLSREEIGGRDEDAESMLRSAVSAMKLGMYEEAKGRLEEIMESNPTNDIQLLGTIYMYYGRVCRFLKHDDRALMFFDHELHVHKLTYAHPKIFDASRRIAEHTLKLGKFIEAKRCAEDLIDYTISRRAGQLFVKQARSLLVSVCLEGYERNFESNLDEKKKLLQICTENIAQIKLLNEGNPDPVSEIETLMFQARCFALNGELEEARKCYKNCIDLSIKTDQLSYVHRAYFEMATYAEGNLLSCIINRLRSAMFYVLKYGKEREVAKYKHELAEKLMAFGNHHEAYLYAMEALELIRKLSLNEYLKEALLIVSKCLAAMGKRRQAAYFIILGSILTVRQESFHSFYTIIDQVMTSERNETAEGEDVKVLVDASADQTTPNQVVAQFVVKLEHTTNIDTWKMVVNDIIDEQARPTVIEKKENEEPVDFMDLIFKMNSRMDDQRTELPASRFLAPRPMSTTSKKTTKSNRILPGLRANFAKMQSMKFDTQTVNRLLKRSKKSKSSLNSTSTQGDDTRSDDVTVLSK
ncbi:hypothetical protein CAEBREN_20599 [Caenorhabditis brenneri]|uniref:Uncharacterized protein n=1 Tax=Caenorhabditis brenneri TaxID=135651 RepID=G0MK18_CAEBE|nr:hypothetical protein CAEBREN_20599 [Caenorhabditis brenneri]